MCLGRLAMKLIHLSDLHLGKRVNEVSMLDDQRYILEQILGIIEDEKPGAVLIAGDVYDKSVPLTEAVTLFDEFLTVLAKKKVPVLIISGNHDSAERLAFGNRLMKESGMYISPVYTGKIEPVVMEDSEGEVYFWMMPFLKPVHVRQYFPEAEIESYSNACAQVVQDMQIDVAKRNVLLAHQFVTGAKTCESEERSVGGTENVNAEVFVAFDYVALGHLHGPQNIGSEKMRYCGSPLKYSFSEAKDHKSVTVAELGKKGELTLRLIPLVAKRDMKEIRGSFEKVGSAEFTDALKREDENALENYCHITLTDEEEIPGVAMKLRAIYPNLMKVSYDNVRTRSYQEITDAEDVEEKSAVALFCELYQKQNNAEMSREQLQYVEELMKKIGEENQ